MARAARKTTKKTEPTAQELQERLAELFTKNVNAVARMISDNLSYSSDPKDAEKDVDVEIYQACEKLVSLRDVLKVTCLGIEMTIRDVEKIESEAEDSCLDEGTRVAMVKECRRALNG